MWKTAKKNNHAGLPHPLFNKTPNSKIIASTSTPYKTPYPGKNAASKRLPTNSSKMKKKKMTPKWVTQLKKQCTVKTP